MSFYSAPLNAKRLEILHELVPKPAVSAALTDANFGDADLRPIEAAARTLGRQLLIVKAGTESEIDSAFAAIVQAGAGALFVGTGALYNSRRRQMSASPMRRTVGWAWKVSAPVSTW